MFKQFLFSIGLVLSFMFAVAQTGKDFWFAVPYIDKTHDSDGDASTQGDENYFRISTGEAGANVTFYHYPGGGASNEAVLYSLYVPANSVETVTLSDSGGDFPLSNYTNSSYETVLDRGIHVTASSPVTIYYEIGSYNNTDIFALKGKDAVGTEFYPAFQNGFHNKLPGDGWGEDSWESVDVVATEDGTTLTVLLPDSSLSGQYTRKEIDTVFRSSGDIIVRNNATTCFKKYTAVDMYKISATEYYKDGVLLSKSAADTTWLIDTASSDYCCTCVGVTTYDDNWANPAKVITIEKFTDQIVSGLNETVTETDIIDSVIPSASRPVNKFFNYKTITVSLDKGQTYSIKSALRSAAKPFDGIIIKSDLPVAVTIKDDTAVDESGTDVAGDVVGDQIIPAEFAGTKYIVSDFNVGTPDMEQGLYIRALVDGTELYEEGTASALATLDAGDVYSYYNFSQSDSYRFIYTNDKPVICFQVAGFESKQSTVTELSGAIIPPVDECTGSTQAAFNIPNKAHGYKLALISRNNAPGTFKYKAEGSASWTDFSPSFEAIDIDADGTDDWFFTLDVGFSPVSGKNYLLKNTHATFHLCVLSGVSEKTSFGGFFGYFSDFTTPELQLGFDTLATGQVQLFAFGGVEGSYQWNLNYPNPGASPSCTDQYFEDKPNCNTDNPIVLSADILARDAYYIYGATGENTCDGTALSNIVSFEVAGHSAFLPIELAYFKAESVTGKMVSLTWQTLSETNNDYFTVERSEDNFYFQAVGKLKGAGNSSVQINYSFNDKVAGNNIYYYRLKQTDYDGSYTYSETIAVYVNNYGDELLIRPTFINDAQDLYVALPEMVKGDVTVMIYTFDGRCVYQNTMSNIARQFIVPAPDENGTYEVFVKTSEIIERQRIIISR